MSDPVPRKISHQVELTGEARVLHKYGNVSHACPAVLFGTWLPVPFLPRKFKLGANPRTGAPVHRSSERRACSLHVTAEPDDWVE